MNPLEIGLYQLLIGDDDVSSLVGERVYGKLAETSQTPYIVFKRISTTREHTLKGNAGIATARIWVNCWSEDTVEASQLANAVRMSLIQNPDAAWGDFTIFGLRVEDEADIDDPLAQVKGDTTLFGVRIETLVTYREEAAA